jgi:hypothetical protein
MRGCHRGRLTSFPVPTRKVSVRLPVTYAGFEGESELLEDFNGTSEGPQPPESTVLRPVGGKGVVASGG